MVLAFTLALSGCGKSPEEKMMEDYVDAMEDAGMDSDNMAEMMENSLEFTERMGDMADDMEAASEEFSKKMEELPIMPPVAIPME